MKEKLINFFNNVMMDLGHHGWTLNFCNDNYCWINKKRIDIDLSYDGDDDGDVRQIILHEIAHIDTAKYSNQKHTPQFWKHLEQLIKKYLKKELDKYQISHKKHMSEGIYNICYNDKISFRKKQKKFRKN